MFLATTALSEFWDKEDEILFLGPWCLRYDRQDEWRKLKYTVLPNPWRKPDDVHRAAAYCDEVINHFLLELSALLNVFHGTQHGERYWRIILGPWLLFYVHALYDRYVHLKRAFESFTDLKTIRLDPFCFKTPVDTIDFVRGAYEEFADFNNLQLYSQILQTLGCYGPQERPTRSMVSAKDPQANTSWTSKAVRGVKRHIRLCGYWVLEGLFSPIPQEVWIREVNLSPAKLWDVALALRFRYRPLDRRVAITTTTIRHEKMRGHFEEIRARDEFQRILRSTLAYNFPYLYLEGFKEFRDDCLRLIPKQPKVLFSAAGWYFDEVFKFTAAEFKERGSRLVGSQHGGGYGMSATLPQEQHEWAVSDAWCSYGWRASGASARVMELPHPRFAPLGRRRSSQKLATESGILLVTTVHPRYPFRFESHPVGAFDVLMEWRLRFIRNLTVRARDNLIVRLNEQGYGWCQEQRLVDSCGPLRFDQGRRSLRAVMRNVGLVVVEYPATAMLEALASNFPTILFWDPTTWQFREGVREYVKAFRKCGILWDSPEGAATKVVEVCDDPAGWWEQSGIQSARKEFVDRYALWREDWVSAWVRMLEQQVNLVQEKIESWR